MTKRRNFTEGHGYIQADWDEVSDNPELTPEIAATARPFREVFPERIKTKSRGRPQSENPKISITFRLTKEVVVAIRSSGVNYTARVEKALRDAFMNLETKLRSNAEEKEKLDLIVLELGSAMERVKGELAAMRAKMEAFNGQRPDDVPTRNRAVTGPSDFEPRTRRTALSAKPTRIYVGYGGARPKARLPGR